MQSAKRVTFSVFGRARAPMFAFRFTNRLIQKSVFITSLLTGMVTAALCRDLVSIPAPNDFIESSSLVPDLRERALIGHPASTQVIGVYLLPDELADILRGGPEHMTIFCRAYVLDELGTEDEAKETFRQMVVAAKREGSKKFDLTDPEQARIIQRYVEATRERRGESVAITGATILGSVMETEDVYANSMLVAASVHTDKDQATSPLTATVAWVRQGNKILELSDVAQFQGAKSISRANGFVVDWVGSVLAANIRQSVNTEKRSRWVEIDAGDSAITYDLDSVQMLAPNKFTIVSAQIDHTDVMKFTLNALSTLRSYCTRPDGNYDAPKELFTLGQPDMPVTQIEVNPKNFPHSVMWREPYKILSDGYSITVDKENISFILCSKPSEYDEQRSSIMGGISSKELYDCDHGVFGIFDDVNSPADRVVLATVRGLFKVAYNRLCPIVTGKLPSASKPE